LESQAEVAAHETPPVIAVDLPPSEALEAASAAFTFALFGIGLLIVGSAVAAATWARSLNGWALGGVSFVLSQTALFTVPVILNLVIPGNLIVALIITGFASAVFQELSRAVILATAARSVPGERGAAVFGLGHGAIDLFTNFVISSYVSMMLLGAVRDGSIFSDRTAEEIQQINLFVATNLISTQDDTVLKIMQAALILFLNLMLAKFVFQIVLRGGGVRAIGLGLLLPIAIHTPVAVVRTLFPMATLPVLLGALLAAILVYRRGRGATVEAAAGQ
jgi:hypothetical protein